MKMFEAIDKYFFCEEDAEIKPYFYGSIGVGLVVSIFILVR